MDVPDFQALGETTIWPVSRWADAWHTLVHEEPHEDRRQAIWSCVVALERYARPDLSVLSMLQVLQG